MYNYIIVSDDKEALKDKIEEIKKSQAKELDVTKYDLELDDIYEILDEIKTISLFDTTKLIIINSLEKIVDISESKLNDLAREMNNFDSENILVFTSLKSLDFRNNTLAQIRRFATLINIDTKTIPFDVYINKYVSDYGYTIDKDAVSTLISYVSSISMLKQSLEILLCYKADEKVITNSDVMLMIKKPLDDSIYQLIEAVLDGNKNRIFEIYKDFKTMNVISPTTIVSYLLNKFHELYNAYIIADGTRNKDEAKAKVAELFNVSMNRAYYIVKNTRNTNMRDILINIKALDELDYKIKSGHIDQNLGLELYFLR